MRNLLALAHARSAGVTLPDRLRLAWRALRSWWHAAILRWIDRYLQRHDQERAYTLLDFEEMDVLYDEVHISVLFDEAGGWAGNPWPERAETVDYGFMQVL
ncbi:MAG: hypothetical protein IAE85_14550 [Anaerolinea sp.]|mgnify:FL=1|jgi:glycosidase|nr:hypothetical protein [Anaerolinea sp.]